LVTPSAFGPQVGGDAFPRGVTTVNPIPVQLTHAHPLSPQTNRVPTQHTLQGPINDGQTPASDNKHEDPQRGLSRSFFGGPFPDRVATGSPFPSSGVHGSHPITLVFSTFPPEFAPVDAFRSTPGPSTQNPVGLWFLAWRRGLGPFLCLRGCHTYEISNPRGPTYEPNLLFLFFFGRKPFGFENSLVFTRHFDPFSTYLKGVLKNPSRGDGTCSGMGFTIFYFSQAVLRGVAKSLALGEGQILTRGFSFPRFQTMGIGREKRWSSAVSPPTPDNRSQRGLPFPLSPHGLVPLVYFVEGLLGVGWSCQDPAGL